MRIASRWVLVLLPLVPFLLAGCGGNSGMGTVKGTVKLNGTPLKEGEIVFLPASGRPAYGKIVDGQIVDVTTNTKGDGVAVGPCKVQVQPAAAADMYAKTKSPIPDKFRDPEKSGLKADIKAGENTVEFDLK